MLASGGVRVVRIRTTRSASIGAGRPVARQSTGRRRSHRRRPLRARLWPDERRHRRVLQLRPRQPRVGTGLPPVRIRVAARRSGVEWIPRDHPHRPGIAHLDRCHPGRHRAGDRLWPLLAGLLPPAPNVAVETATPSPSPTPLPSVSVAPSVAPSGGSSAGPSVVGTPGTAGTITFEPVSTRPLAR